MSTHTLGIAEEIADRIGIVDRGRMRFLGTFEELRQSLARDRASLEQLFLDVTAASDEPLAGSTAAEVP
jgi:ABC-2 type transport system ATP-binding protein